MYEQISKPVRHSNLIYKKCVCTEPEKHGSKLLQLVSSIYSLVDLKSSIKIHLKKRFSLLAVPKARSKIG